MALIWSPEPETVDDAALVSRIEAMTYSGRKPRDPALIEMLGAVSHRLLDDPSARRVPHYVALAYWLRPAALNRLSLELAHTDTSGRVRVPRGIALHLPPTNVDTIFVYSWAMSVLAGNANIMRLAERLEPATQWLVANISQVVAEHGEADRHLFCHYAYGEQIELELGRLCDLRMIWGGDAKVEAVSRVPIRPDGLSIGFPDRQSLAIISTDAYRQADASARDGLAADFFNDVFWFDQMGCGSPRVLVWLGEEPGALAADFYGRVNRLVDERGYGVSTGVSISKFVLANDLLADGVVTGYAHVSNALDVSRTADPAVVMARPHGGGFLVDWVASAVDDVPPIITRKVQTITHYGVAPEDIARLAHGLSGRGGYRIVPVGQALQFDPTWDGVDLFQHMTRSIVVR